MVHDLMSAVTPVCVLLIAQAGNKSSLSYRSDNGIPGYTGYIPGFATVPIGTKGSTQHTGTGSHATAICYRLHAQVLVTSGKANRVVAFLRQRWLMPPAIQVACWYGLYTGHAYYA